MCDRNHIVHRKALLSASLRLWPFWRCHTISLEIVKQHDVTATLMKTDVYLAPKWVYSGLKIYGSHRQKEREKERECVSIKKEMTWDLSEVMVDVRTHNCTKTLFNIKQLHWTHTHTHHQPPPSQLLSAIFVLVGLVWVKNGMFQLHTTLPVLTVSSFPELVAKLSLCSPY